jgi:hypothetical protein
MPTTTHVYFYHAQAVRPDGKIDMYSGIFRTGNAIVNEATFQQARDTICKACKPLQPKWFVIMSLSHIATEG